MTQRNAYFPLSARNTRLAVILSFTCGLLVIITSGLSALASPDKGFPFQNLILASALMMSAWGLYASRRWAWRLATFIAGWQIYFGVGSLITYFNAESNNLLTTKIIVMLFTMRTILLLILFLLLVFFTERERLYKNNW